jgi:NADH-quinone oxidoreductase subunit M
MPLVSRRDSSSGRPLIAGLAVVGIIYGALTALTQKDLKFVIGYSSVSHMGFIVVRYGRRQHWGLRGAVLQMISHGIIAGLLFGIAGRVVYERTHTRDLGNLQASICGNRCPVRRSPSRWPPPPRWACRVSAALSRKSR